MLICYNKAFFEQMRKLRHRGVERLGQCHPLIRNQDVLSLVPKPTVSPPRCIVWHIEGHYQNPPPPCPSHCGEGKRHLAGRGRVGLQSKQQATASFKLSAPSHFSPDLFAAPMSKNYPGYCLRCAGHAAGRRAPSTPVPPQGPAGGVVCAACQTLMGCSKSGSPWHRTPRLGPLVDVMGTKGSVVREPGKD